MARQLAILALTLLLTACAIGPDYKRPEMAAPNNWQTASTGNANLADTPWWEQFGDPALNELIRIALQENKDLKVAAARVDQYLGVLDTTRSQFFPQIGYSAGASRQQTSDNGPLPVPSAPYSTYQGYVNATWEIDLWGRIRRANEAARAQVLASEEGRRGVILSLVASVANNYLILRGLDKQLDISRSTEKSYGESLELFRLRYEHGAISMLELSQVESQYESARQAVPYYEGLVARQEHLISVLLGRNPGKIPRGKSIDELTQPQLPMELPLSLLERRPDLRRAEQELIAANAQIGATKALYFPTISLGGLIGLQSKHLDDLFMHSSGMWSFGGAAVGPLFTFGAISGQVKQAEAIEQQALYRYEQQVLVAYKDVEDALVGSVKGKEQQDAQGRQVKALEEYARVARLQYEGGMTDYLKVLDAERSLFSAQLAYVQTQAGVLGSSVDMYKALGGGWVNAAERLGTTPAAGTAAAPVDTFPCMAEIEQFCKDAKPGTGQLLECLSKHDKELSPVCREKVAKTRERLEEGKRICGPDIQKFCANVPQGEGRLLNCLRQNYDSLVPACQEQVKHFGGIAVGQPAAGSGKQEGR